MPLCGLSSLLQHRRATTLSALQCPHPPKILYRVQHAHSQAQFDPQGNLHASLAHRVPESLFEFKSALERHLRWGYAPGESYFMSCFGDVEDARVWGAGKEGGGGGVRIYLIRVGEVRKKGGMVFRVEDVRRKLGMGFREGEEGGVVRKKSRGKSTRGKSSGGGGGFEGEEYVILSRIPKRAIELLEEVEPPFQEEMSPNPKEVQAKPSFNANSNFSPDDQMSLSTKTSSTASPTYLLRALKRQSRCLALLNSNKSSRQQGIPATRNDSRMTCSSTFTLKLDLMETSFEGMFEDLDNMREENRRKRVGEERVDSVLEEREGGDG